MYLLTKIASTINSLYRHASDIYNQVTEIYNQLSETRTKPKVKKPGDPNYIKKFIKPVQQQTIVKNRPTDRKRKGKIHNNEMVYNHPRR